MLEDLFSIVKSRATGAATAQSAGDGHVSVPADLMFKCPRCQKMEFMENFTLSGKVCPSCNYHSRLTARERLEITADPTSFSEYDAALKSVNPIDFPGYPEKLAQLRAATGLEEAIITGECAIEGSRCVIGVMDSHFMMASMGSVVGEKITRAFEKATEKKLPVVMFTASGGARMQEGIISLMQMAKTSGAVSRHDDSGGLYITVLTDPTTGGVAASFAALGDIIIAEPKVLIGFAGRRVIENTIRQRLPDDFQSAEFFLSHGFVDMIVERSAMRKTLGRLLRFHERGDRP
ncbi:MAG: acetyl-CoA carboxylase, carboxyltransferase subunit beta [Oscillospiraceae bacterium]|nr:acetyl-CoA carboxylase, carboxyltransferase subunit beta [Oscillospiraceae bacterium]